MASDEASEITALRSELTRLKRRLDRTESIQRIEQLMYRYIHACDVVKNADLISSMFTEDARWEGQGHFAEFGTTRGRAAIREMFVDNPRMLPFTAHFLTNASVGVSPGLDKGWGTWHVLEAATLAESRAQVWMLAWYDNDFVNVDGVWMIEHLRFRDTVVAPYEEGWLRSTYVSPRTLERITRI